MSELASALFSIADANEFRFARFYIVCEEVALAPLKSPLIVCGLPDTPVDCQSVAKTQNLMSNAVRKKCSDFSLKNPPLPEAAGTIRCSDFLHNKTSPAFFVAAATGVSTVEDASAAVTRNRAARIFNPCFFMFSSFLPQIPAAAAFSHSSRQCFLHL